MRLDTRHLWLALLALGWQGHARAQDIGQPAQAGTTASTPAQHSGYVDLLAGLGYTDNALLTSQNHASDGIATVGFNVD